MHRDAQTNRLEAVVDEGDVVSASGLAVGIEREHVADDEVVLDEPLRSAQHERALGEALGEHLGVPLHEEVHQACARTDLVTRGATDDVVRRDVHGVDRRQSLEGVELGGLGRVARRELALGVVTSDAVELAVQDRDEEVAVATRRLQESR